MKKIFLILFILLAPALPISLQAEEKSRHYNTYEIKTSVDAETYEAMVYEPKLTKIKAMLYISPTIGTWDSIEGANAQFFSKHGYIVIVPYRYKTEITNPHPNMDRLDSDYYRSVTSAISFINLVTSKFKLSESLPVFALGASQGGINTVMITSYVPRITAAWFAVGGGNLPHIYAYSDTAPLVKFRQNHMNDLGITDQAAYEKYLASYLKNDPAISCKQIRVPIHQVIALHDTTVPTVTQELLVKECPPHEVDRKNVTHSGGTLSIVVDREKIKRFFEKYL